MMSLRSCLDTCERILDTFTALESLTRESLGFTLCALGFTHVFGVGFAVGAVELGETLLLGHTFFGGAGCGFVEFGSEGEFRTIECSEFGVEFRDGGFVAAVFGDFAAAEYVLSLDVGEAGLEDARAFEFLLNFFVGPGAVQEVVNVGDFRDEEGFCGKFQLFGG